MFYIGTNSEPPKPKKRRAATLIPAVQDLLIEGARGPWCMSTMLKVDGATALRRGELLALRWTDLQDGYFTIERSLSQTKAGLEFKCTKTGDFRKIMVPAEALIALQAHRQQQDEFRRQYGSDYRTDLDLIFCSPDGTPLKPDSVSATISQMFRRLGIEKPKGDALHLLRHTHSSCCSIRVFPWRSGCRLGHRHTYTLHIYGHMTHGQEEEAVRSGRTPPESDQEEQDCKLGLWHADPKCRT